MSDLPPEPPIGSTVADRDDDEWDRLPDGDWCWAGNEEAESAVRSWAWLNYDFGPLTVLREGPAS